MAKPKHPVWAHYHQSASKINNSHYAAYCKYCVKKHKGVFRDETKVTGQPERMKAHLAKCFNAPEDIRDYYAALRNRKSGSADPPMPESMVMAMTASAAVSPTAQSVVGLPGDVMSEQPPMKRRKGDMDASSGIVALDHSRLSEDEQAKSNVMLETLLLNATVSAGLPFDWIDNWEVLQLFRFLCPHLVLPDCARLWESVLLRRLEDLEQEEVTTLNKAGVAGLVCSSWTEVVNNHAFAWNVVCGCATQRTVISAFNIEELGSAEPTAATAYDHFMSSTARLSALTQEQTRVGWVVADGTGSYRAMMRSIAAKHPSVVVIECLAHTISMVAKHAITADKQMMTTIQTVFNVIALFREHPLAMHALREMQCQIYEAERVLVLPVEEQWDSIVTMLESLIRSQEALAAVSKQLLEDRATVFGNQSDSAAQVLLSMIGTDLSEQVAEALQILKPLILARTQFNQSTARLDNAFCMLGRLATHFHQLSMAESSRFAATARTCIEELERRWEQMEQPAFLVAYVLNPFYRLDGIRRDEPQLAWLKVMELAAALYERVFEEAPKKIYLELTDYMEQTNAFAASRVEQFRSRATLEPEIVWRYAAESYGEAARVATLLSSVSVSAYSSDHEVQQLMKQVPAGIARPGIDGVKKAAAWAKIKKQIVKSTQNNAVSSSEIRVQDRPSPQQPETTSITTSDRFEHVLNDWKNELSSDQQGLEPSKTSLPADRDEAASDAATSAATAAPLWQMPLCKLFAVDSAPYSLAAPTTEALKTADGAATTAMGMMLQAGTGLAPPPLEPFAVEL